MTRNILKTLIAICIVAIFLVINVFVIQPIFAKGDKKKMDYKYHVQVLIDNDYRGKSCETFKQELIDKGNENNIFVEIIEVENNQNKKELVEQGIYSKVDGIAFASDSKKQGDYLYKKAKNNKISMVNYGMSPFKFEKMLSIGIEEKQLADRAVNELCKNTNKKDKILVFLNQENKKNTLSNKLIIKEFKKQFKKNKRKVDNIKFIKVDKDKYEVSSYIIKNIDKYRNYDTIVSLDMKYSSIIGNILANKEVSKLSKKTFIAYGENKENLGYLKKGIIDTIITSDGVDMADKLIATMIDLKTGAKLRNYITNTVVISEKDGKIKYETNEVVDDI